MLNKVLIGTIVNIVLNGLRVLFPDLGLPEGLAEAITVLVVFIAQFFTKETALTVAKLVTK